MMHVQLAGHFSLYVSKDGSQGRKVAEFDNLITDAGLDAAGTSDPTSYVQVGAGSTAPAFTDTSLASYLAGTMRNRVESGAYVAGTPDYGKRVITWQFAQGAAAGNIAEIGISSAVSGSVLFSRALVTDEAGAPTTITVQSDEYLTVVYELRVYAPAASTTANVTISGVNYDLTILPIMVNNPQFWVQNAPKINGGTNNAWYMYSLYTGGIASRGSTNPGGSLIGSSQGAWDAYTSGSYKRSLSMSVDVNTANGTIASAMITSGWQAWQVGFSPAIVKDNTKTLSLSFYFSWGRYTP